MIDYKQQNEIRFIRSEMTELEWAISDATDSERASILRRMETLQAKLIEVMGD